MFRHLGLLLETVDALLVAVLPILDPFVTFTNVTGQVFSRCREMTIIRPKGPIIHTFPTAAYPERSEGSRRNCSKP